MAAPGSNSSNDARRGHQSPRPKGRENAKNVLCRNITIYGSCRAQNNGCPYNHEVGKYSQQSDAAKRFLSVDSPSFTPLAPATNTQTTARALGISPKAATAAVFTPKASTTPAPPASQTAPEWPREVNEFVPQRYSDYASNATQSFDPFSMQTSLPSLSDIGDSSHQQSINPYAQDAAAPMYQNTTAFTHPLNYHLYAPLGPHRENLMPYQRTTHDFFIPDPLREDLQRKSEALRQVFPNSSLPQQIEHFHSLVALDTNTQRAPTAYGYPSWIYKAVSDKDGLTYALRRLEGFRLTDERAVRTVQTWKRINSGSVVTVHDAFTTRAFGDSSLIVVTDYHPLSQTLAEKYSNQTTRHPNSRSPGSYASDHELWGYVVQLASALKAIHSLGLAARLLIPQKVLMTSKNRLRLNTCGILDITQYEQGRSLSELQQDDLLQFGRLILCIATKNPSAHHNVAKGLEHVARLYGDKLKDAVSWLLAPPSPTSSPMAASASNSSSPAPDAESSHTIDAFLTLISARVAQTLDASLHEADSLTSNLSRELENARLVRLLAKLNLILERADASTPSSSTSGPNKSGPAAAVASQNSAHSLAWAETGERYYIKLFRDFVFHTVDAEGRPVLDLGHVLGALNKLDAGVEEKVMLVSRDEQNCFVVSYREVKRGVESAWNELVKAAGAPGRR